ncbi:hypothetical protein HON22_03625 [Candidatus Peregrinibacteria bacterium]|jgi:hypothetical protein|nr:hypothetical protein [Candidatus Peregrinibacteria bacterium]
MGHEHTPSRAEQLLEDANRIIDKKSIDFRQLEEELKHDFPEAFKNIPGLHKTINPPEEHSNKKPDKVLFS